jgi:hypothetical protein
VACVIASDSEAIQLVCDKILDFFVAHAPLRKRFPFVAGNDEEGLFEILNR